ncbi:DUF687 family protein [Chlamydia sp. 04-14]|uniref:DUF687 family protein n=1 Tax=Chlamydia TaxID=810 RepID=UPI002FC6103E
MTAPTRPNPFSSGNDAQGSAEVRNDENIESVSEISNQQASSSNRIAVISIPEAIVPVSQNRSLILATPAIRFLVQHLPSGNSLPRQYHRVGVGYVNGSSSTYREAMVEAIHLSEALVGGPVLGVYHSGRELTRRYLTFLGSLSQDSVVCQVLLAVWEEYFSQHPEGCFLQYFYGDGGHVIDAALAATPYIDRIEVIGISPTFYPRVGRVTTYRLSGDVTSLLDREGFLLSQPRTLSYSHNSFGVFFPSFCDPAFLTAIRSHMLEAAHVTVLHQTVGPSTSLINVNAWEGILANNQVELISFSPGNSTFFDRVISLANSPLTFTDTAENYVAPGFIERCTVGLSMIVRVMDIVTLFFWTSDGETMVSIGICAGIMGLALARYSLIVFTNSQRRRRRFRWLRLFALACAPMEILVNTADIVNALRLLIGYRMDGCDTALYAMLLNLGIFLNVQELITFPLTRVRGALQEYSFRVLSLRTSREISEEQNQQGAVVPAGRDMVQDARMVSEAALVAVHGLIFPYVSMVISMAGISLHSSCRTVNGTEEDVITHPFPPFSEALEDGDVYAVSQVVNVVFCFFFFIANLVIFTRIFRIPHRRR